MQTEILTCSPSISCDSSICVSHVPFDVIYPLKKNHLVQLKIESASSIPALSPSQKIQTRGQGCSAFKDMAKAQLQPPKKGISWGGKWRRSLEMCHMENAVCVQGSAASHSPEPSIRLMQNNINEGIKV